MPRRRMRGGRLTGSQVLGALRKAHDYVKKNQLISKTANALGATRIGAAAGALGYGKRRRRRRVM